jgi:hypothetical protein
MSSLQEYRDLWGQCRDGTIGRITRIDKAGYCELRDIDDAVVRKHEPLSKLRTEKEDFGIYIAGVAGKQRR